MRRHVVREAAWAGLPVGVLLTAALGSAQQEAPSSSHIEALGPAQRQLLEENGMKVTAGAAPGYVADRHCGGCHPKIARSYRELGMSRSFARPGGNRWVEDFGVADFFHQKSARYYRLERRGNELHFRRYQKDTEGRPINVYERQVDWVLGSGSVSRSYLIQEPGGELYVLPVAWYSQGSGWRMAPGYDRADHDGLGRRVRRECMFCHNAYPDVPAGSDQQAQHQSFPNNLPQGIGCQRCHGPGAGHIAAVLEGSSPERVADSITNPAQLPAKQRRDVCSQCHLQPAVALFGIRHYDRGDLSFRPGQDLDDYLVQVDVREVGRPAADRFEINHHAYRLEQSRCFVESGQGLDCLTCHDPHSKPPRPHRMAKVRRACLGCHSAGRVSDASIPTISASGEEHFSRAECVSCHMPRRRSQDVVHTVMTDHRIQRVPPPSDALIALEERRPVIEDVWPIRPGPIGASAPFYLVSGLLRIGHTESLDDFERALWRRPPEESAPFFDLARSRLLQRHWPQAGRALDLLHERHPADPLVREWLAMADLGQGKPLQARGRLERLVAEAANRQLGPRPEAPFNLGLIEAGLGNHTAALSWFGRALELRPNMVSAWRNLGVSFASLGRHSEAADAFRRALAVDPGDTESYEGMVAALVEQGERAEAVRYLEHGRQHSRFSDRLRDIRLDKAGGDRLPF